MIRQSLFVGSSAIDIALERSTASANAGEILVSVPADARIRDQLEAVERTLYRRAATCCGSINEVGERLGVTRQTASRRMEQLGIDAPRGRKRSGGPDPAEQPSDSLPKSAEEARSVDVFSAFTQGRIDRTLASVLRDEARPDPVELVASVRRHLEHLVESVTEHRFVDPNLAERLAASLIALAEDRPGCPQRNPPEARRCGCAVLLRSRRRRPRPAQFDRTGRRRSRPQRGRPRAGTRRPHHRARRIASVEDRHLEIPGDRQRTELAPGVREDDVGHWRPAKRDVAAHAQLDVLHRRPCGGRRENGARIEHVR